MVHTSSVFRFAVCVIGEMLDTLPVSSYIENVRRLHHVVFRSWKHSQSNVLTSGHVAGERVSELHSQFQTLHTFKLPDYDSMSDDRKVASRRTLFRLQLSDVFSLLVFERVPSCLVARVDVYVHELTRPRSMSVPYIIPQLSSGMPFEGVFAGRVSSLKSCSMHTAITGIPTYQLKTCCAALHCQPFHRYSLQVKYSSTQSYTLESNSRQDDARRRQPLPHFAHPPLRSEGMQPIKEMNTTAVVVVGGVRTLLLPTMQERLRSRVLDPLKADLFLYVDERQISMASTCDARSKSHGKEAVNLTQMISALAPRAFATFDDCRAFGKVKPTHGTEAEQTMGIMPWDAEPLIQDEDALWSTCAESLRPINCSYAQYRGEYAPYAWMEKAFALMTRHENERAQRYEWVLKMRPDLLFTTPILVPKLVHARSRSVYGFPYLRTMLLSWWALMPRTSAAFYFQVFSHAMRRCDLHVSERSECDGLDARSAVCVHATWMRKNGVFLDRAYASRVETMLLRYDERGKQDVLTSQQMRLVERPNE